MHDSAWGRIAGVLTAPSRTFESIARRPTWLVPMLVLMVLATTSGVLAWQRVDVDEVARQARAAMEKQGRATDEEQLEQIVRVNQGIGYGCSAVAPPIAYLICALVLMAAFKLAGGEIGFPASLSVTLYGMMPWAIAAVLTIPVVLARQQPIDPRELQAGVLLASSAAALAPPDAGPVALAVLGSFDLFSFWTIALLAIGFAIAAKVSRGRAVAIVIGSWLAWVAVKIALATVGSAFGGGAA